MKASIASYINSDIFSLNNELNKIFCGDIFRGFLDFALEHRQKIELRREKQKKINDARDKMATKEAEKIRVVYIEDSKKVRSLMGKQEEEAHRCSEKRKNRMLWYEAYKSQDIGQKRAGDW